MDLTLELHLTAGAGALVLGAAVLLDRWRSRRNRYVALLCGALAVWNLGVVLSVRAAQLPVYWPGVYLLGSCAAAPLGLHMVLALTGKSGPLSRGLLYASYSGAALLYLSSWSSLHDRQPSWNLVAIAFLSTVLLVALSYLLRDALSVPEGAARSAKALIFIGGVVAVAGGLSDLVPRGANNVPMIGSATILVFLLILCASVLRYRFLDVNSFLMRAFLVGSIAAGVTLVLLAVIGLFGVRFLPLFAAIVVLSLWIVHVGKERLTPVSGVFRRDPIAEALFDTSQRLPQAETEADVWNTIEMGRSVLPAEVHLGVYFREGAASDFERIYAIGIEGAPQFSPDDPIPSCLESEHAPVTRPYLEAGLFGEPEGESGEPGGSGGSTVALAAFRAHDIQLAVPLFRTNRLLGWISLGGGKPARYLRPEVADGLLAVGNQTIAGLERLAALEKAKRREALLVAGELAAGLAHEVRNPVAAVHGAAQAIGSASTPRQQEEMLGIIREESDRLARVVGEFLDYARPASPRRESVDLAGVAREVIGQVRGRSPDFSIELEPGSGDGTARGDPDQITRVFENLIRNAREAAGPRGTLRIEIESASSGRVAARFRDNGPGLDKDQMRHVFEPFYTKKEGGTGLGLAIVHRIVESHGGEITVESRPGSGAVFTVSLPAFGEAA